MIRQISIASYYLLILGASLVMLLSGCRSQKNRILPLSTKKPQVISNKILINPEYAIKPSIQNNFKANIVRSAYDYLGVKYRLGGTTSKGMDCSGLVHTVLRENEILFPRSSFDMAKEGTEISLNEVQMGDLLFFQTNSKAEKINHVGLVVDVKNNDIRFIHATTSRGVLVSSLQEGYWKSVFVKATRFL